MTVCLRKIASAALLCLTAALFAGCGVKGAPQPDYSRDSFGIAELSSIVEPSRVLIVEGRLTDSFQNVDHLILQVQPVDGELCSGCPFLPQEQFLIETEDIWKDGDGTTFDVVYSPVFAADMYRWRIIGHNTYAGIPPVVTDVQTAGTESAFAEQGMPVPVPPVQ